MPLIYSLSVWDKEMEEGVGVGTKSNFTAKDKYKEEGETDGYTVAEEGRGGETWEQNNSIIEQRSCFSRTAAGRAALSQI